MSAPNLTTARGAFAAAAIDYARRGWLTFPCAPGGKVPLTRNGLHNASRDPEQLARWAKLWPRANIGIRTGAESGLVVLDVDGDDGAESLRRLEAAHGGLPRTLSVTTPRGGQHYYFAHPGSAVPNSAGTLGTGLDVRGDGGYVIAAPSVGAGGVIYEVDDESPAAALPSWLAGALRPPVSGGEAAPAETWIRMVRDGIPAGQRNSSLARLIGHMLARDLDARVVLELALLVNRASCKPPLPVREVERTVLSIARRELVRRYGGGQA